MPDIKELGRKVKAKYPGKYDDLEDADLGRRVKAKYPGAYDDFTDAPIAQPPGFVENIKIGAERGYRKYLEPAISSIAEVAEGMKQGDFGPAWQMVKEGARGTYNALTIPDPQVQRDPTGRAVGTSLRPPDPVLQAAQSQRQARYQSTPQGQRSAQRLSELDQRAALDPSYTGKAVRGATELLTGAAPTIATAIATRGAVLPTAFTAAAQSANNPSQALPQAALGSLPVPIGQAFRAGVNAIRRTFGKGAAQIIEAEALPAATARVRESIGEPPPLAAEAPPVSPTSLQSAFAKLGTDNPDEVGGMIANANRRLNETITVPGQAKRPITAEERLSSWEDYNKLRQITADEHRALSQVLPARNYEPVGIFEKGKSSRNITDIPAGEPNAQLDANMRELEAFFSGQSTAPRIAAETALPAPQIAERMAAMARTPTSPVSLPTLRAEFPALSKQQFDDEVLKLAEQGQVAIHRHDAPGLLSEAERNAMVKVGNDYFTAATVRGPSVSGRMDALNVAVSEAAASVPRSFAQKAKDELLGTLGASKSLRSTADISYPLRQGALLLRPFQWRQAGQVWKEMFRSFRTKNFDAIKEAIDTHPLAGRMESAGLKPFPGAGEEAFARRAGSKVSEIVHKTPIVKQSGQAYDAAAATQRVQAFEQYARLIDKAGLSAEEALKADKAAAQWINIATGRGSLGQTLDKAMEGLNFFFFSPRYVASRLNVFNPAMYIRNASSPGGRVVLKQQMSDLMQFASVVATTMYLAKQAGADVTLNPNSPDFLKIRAGNWRYDPLAGLQQVMRLIYRTGADIFGRAGRGKKPVGATATDIAQTFLSYKLSPPAGVFRDFINQRTVDKKPFSGGRAIADLTAPMQWADFVEAYQKEAWGGVAKTAPGAVGVGVQNYESPPIQAAIDKAQPLLSELQRLNKRVSELHRKDGEKDDAFNARVQQFSANYTRFGKELIASPRFQAAPDALKAIALDRLNERAKHITHREFAFPELELDANVIMDAAEQSKKNPANK